MGRFDSPLAAIYKEYLPGYLEAPQPREARTEPLDRSRSLKRADLWEELVVWLATPPSSRGAVSTEEEWAVAHNTTARTMRRWKQDPKFVEMQAAYQKRLEVREAARVAGEPEPMESVEGEDEKSYLKVKAKLIEGAASGNPKYMEMYFKTYGKPFVEEEAAARTTDLVALDLDELIVKTVSLLDPKSLARELAALGWVAVPPGGNSDEG